MANRSATHEVKADKEFYGWPEEAQFLVPDGIYRISPMELAPAVAPRNMPHGATFPVVPSRRIPTWPSI